MKQFFAVAAYLIALASSPTLADSPRLTLVELYTSQGCSSCPAADVYLGELAARDDILALSFHVDYWDYIGWKDPYADGLHTGRQKSYAQQFGLRYVYTPQMVVHGMAEGVGSDRKEIGALINKAKPTAALDIQITRPQADKTGRIVTARIPKGPPDSDAHIWLVTFDKEHLTDVRRGENSGQTLRNKNVVRHLAQAGRWSGQSIDVTVDLSKQSGDACAVIVQDQTTGKVFGAAQLDLL